MARTIKADWKRDFLIHGWGQSELIKAFNVEEAKEIFCKQFNDQVMRWNELNELGQIIYNGPTLSKIAKKFGFKYMSGMIKIDNDDGKSKEIIQWLEDNSYQFTIKFGNGRTGPLTTTYLEFRMW